MQTTESFSIGQFLKSRTGLVLLAFLAIAAFFLIAEHTAHVFGVLPYALLLLCPLLHLFMHKGHGGHGDQDNHAGHTDHSGHSEEKQSPLFGGKS
jgi:hypothetical protein